MPTLRKLYEDAGSRVAGEGPHVGLVLDRLVKPQAGNQESAAEVHRIAARTASGAPVGYADAFARWQRATPPGEPHRRVFRMKTASPLRVGAGRPSPLENHLALHPTWGTPYVPGSAIKGVVRAWLTENMADDPRWGPGGDWFVALVGVGADARGRGASAGAVDFLDALAEPQRFELVSDITTPHYRGYYEKAGGRPPDGMEGPNPITFLAAQGTFRFVVEGAPDLLDAAVDIVARALQEHGVGGKTRSGYGRFECESMLGPLDLELQETIVLRSFGRWSPARQVAWIRERASTAFTQNAEQWLLGAAVQLAELFDRLPREEAQQREVLRLIATPESRRRWRQAVNRGDGRKKDRAQALLALYERLLGSSGGGGGPSAAPGGATTKTAAFGTSELKDKDFARVDSISKAKRRLKEAAKLAQRVQRHAYTEASIRRLLGKLEEWGVSTGTIQRVRRHYGLDDADGG